ncbi:MAG: hypothetical protein ACR2L6_00745, partial [Gemmatimonadaceae bacterium]
MVNPRSWTWAAARPARFCPVHLTHGDEMTDRPAIRVILVDDHPIFRAGVRALLAAVPDVVLVGEAG